MTIKPPTREEVEGAGTAERIGGQLVQRLLEEARAHNADLMTMSVAVALLRAWLADEAQRVLGTDGAALFSHHHEQLTRGARIHEAPSPDLAGVAVFRSAELEDTAEAPLR